MYASVSSLREQRPLKQTSFAACIHSKQTLMWAWFCTSHSLCMNVQSVSCCFLRPGLACVCHPCCMGLCTPFINSPSKCPICAVYAAHVFLWSSVFSGPVVVSAFMFRLHYMVRLFGKCAACV